MSTFTYTILVAAGWSCRALATVTVDRPVARYEAGERRAAALRAAEAVLGRELTWREARSAQFLPAG